MTDELRADFEGPLCIRTRGKGLNRLFGSIIVNRARTNPLDLGGDIVIKNVPGKTAVFHLAETKDVELLLGQSVC
jgi:hypothetical protein